MDQRRESSGEEESDWNPVGMLAHWCRDHLLLHSQCERCVGKQKNKCNKSDRQRRRAPTVTLFFDGDKKMTIAVLSQTMEPLSVYFACRVQQGTALQRSHLYFELEGYVRENYTKIRRQQGFSPDDISFAVGALEASDSRQQNELEEQQRQDRERHASTTTFHQFEEVMEIVRQHRLNDDLDVLSIYFLRQVNKTCGRIAARVAQHRMEHTTLSITPYVDGACLSGYSRFRRAASTIDDEQRDDIPDLDLVRQTEFGRAVEYQRCPDIILKTTRNEKGIFVASTHETAPGGADFSWDCEELALANLHRWWGDIAQCDYVGQKLVLSCSLVPADQELGRGDFDLPVDRKTSAIVGTVHLEASPVGGAYLRLSIPGASNIGLHVLESQTRSLDDVAVSYRGKARVESVQFNFLALVRAAARRSMEPLRHKYLCIEDERPLLEHERAYLRDLQTVASS